MKQIRNLGLLVIGFCVSQCVKSQTVVNMKKENGIYTIPCKVNGLKLKFIFDTGASSVSISMTEATFMLKNDYLDIEDIIGTSNYLDANGDINVGVDVILKELEIGGLKITNVKAKVVNNIKAPLLLGQSAISKLGTIQLNLDKNQLIILNGFQNEELQIRNNIDSQTQIQSLDTPVVYNNFTLASNAYDNGDYDEAISYCNAALSENEKDTSAYILRGFAFDTKKEYEFAIEDYTSAIKLQPKNGKYYCYRGESKTNLYQYADALADLNKGLSLAPNYKSGYIWRSSIKKAKSDYTGALMDINKAISIDPKDSSLYNQRGQIKNSLKDYNNAISDFNKIIKGDPTNYQAFLYRGDSKIGLKDYFGAKNDYEKSIEYYPGNPEVYASRARLKEILKDYEGAMEDYDKAIELDSTYLWAILNKNILSKKIDNDTWIKIGDGNANQKYYISKSIVSNYQSVIKIWVKVESPLLNVFTKGKKVQYKNGHELWLMNFDCSLKKLKFSSIYSYDSNGKAVRHQDEYDLSSDWEDVAPDTVGEFFLRKVCEKYN